MRKMIMVGLLLLGILPAQAQHEFTIKGKVQGLEDGIVIELFKHEGNIMSRVAEDTVRNEGFQFKTKTPSGGLDNIMLSVFGHGFPNTWLDLWVEPDAEITVRGNNKLLRTWKVESNVAEQSIQNKFIDAARELIDEEQNLYVEMESLYGMKHNDSIQQQLSKLAKQSAAIREKIIPIELKLIKELPVSPVWMRIMRELSMEAKLNENFPYRQELLEVYDRIDAKQRQTEIGKDITVLLFPPTVLKIGEQIADADLYDLNGKIHHLSDNKGKFILLDFWSRGCGPCMMALPEMKEIAETYKDKLEVISLSIDNEKNWREVSATKNMTWQNLNELQGSNGLYAKYGVNGIPFYIIISPDGVLLHKWMGYGQGLLKFKIRRWIGSDKKEMSIIHNDEVKIVNYPTELEGDTDYLEIRQVELRDTATVIRGKAYYLPKNWIRINPDSFLKSDSGEPRKLLSAEGITPGEKFVMPESGEAEFIFVFEPISADSKTLTFTEGEGRGNWNIRVSLTNDKAKE